MNILRYQEFGGTSIIKIDPIPILTVSEVENNRFYVYGTNTKFFWTVYGKRSDIDVEPLKKDVNVKGDGPYLWI